MSQERVDFSIGEEDLAPPEGIKLQLPGGETVEVSSTEVIGWKEILAAEAKRRKEVRLEGVSYDAHVPGDPVTVFDETTLDHLKGEIKVLFDEEGTTDNQVRREVFKRYHPDLYTDASDEVRKLAEDYFKTAKALDEHGQIQRNSEFVAGPLVDQINISD